MARPRYRRAAQVMPEEANGPTVPCPFALNRAMPRGRGIRKLPRPLV
jgi:hypothetical protein